MKISTITETPRDITARAHSDKVEVSGVVVVVVVVVFVVVVVDNVVVVVDYVVVVVVVVWGKITPPSNPFHQKLLYI